MSVTKKMLEKTIAELNEIAETLQSYVEEKDDQIGTEEDKNKPNDEKLEKLNSQRDILDNAVNDINDITSNLEDYET
jgi:hypothetical protein